MTNYIDEIFLRADLQQVREFLLQGVGCDIDPRPYLERIKIPEKRALDRLEKEYPNKEEFEEITGLMYDYVDAVQAVYMEIGLQVGALLASQAGGNLKTAFAKDAK
ncbi:hypothetical protein [Allofournierella sp.]|uniref:hypothetical protein n=1 Tax=Allofournierella sp. TaxID=1940256 RepID=UPI003AB4FB03